MRIVSGTYGGRRLLTPKNNKIRPTSDKIRGAIFNALESRDSVRDAIVLDIFCGTGALGIEALSRGAAHCTFIDKARSSLDLAQKNAENIKIRNDVDFILKGAQKLNKKPDTANPASLVFLDPPYDKNLATPTLKVLDEHGWLTNHALCVVETEDHFSDTFPENFSMLQERTYKATTIFFLEYIKN